MLACRARTLSRVEFSGVVRSSDDRDHTTAFLREWLAQRATHPEAVGWQTEQFLMHRERVRRDLAELLDLDNLDQEDAIRNDVSELLELLAATIRGNAPS